MPRSTRLPGCRLTLRPQHARIFPEGRTPGQILPLALSDSRVLKSCQFMRRDSQDARKPALCDWQGPGWPPHAPVRRSLQPPHPSLPPPAPAASDPGTGLRATAQRPQPGAHPSSPPPHLPDAAPSSLASPSPASTPPSLGSLLLHLLLLFLVLLLLTESGSSWDQPWAARPLLSRR